MKSIYFYFFLIINLLFTKGSLAQGDDCYSAFTLSNVINYCSNTAIYTNVGSTASGLANATCWTGAATSDVWFSFTATGTDILISANGSGFGGTMSRPRIALYFGTCSTTSTTVNQLGCNNGTAGSGFTQLYVGGLILGQTYLIRISSTTANVGTFELCVNNFTPPPSAGADCGGASYLCNKNSLSVSGLNGGGLNPDEPTNEVNSCMTGSFLSSAETNSAWYTWTCGTSGTLLFDIIPSNLSNDIDFVLYQLNSSNPCGTRTIIRCNTASCLNAASSTGLNATDTDISEQPGCAVGANAYCQQINMVAGTSYALLINNADGTSGFSLNWGGTGTFLGPNPNIVASDTTICVGETVIFDGSTSTNSASYNWTFNGNGAPVNISGVGPHSISYPNVGTYVAILQTTSSLGCSSTEFKNIVVSPAVSLSVTATPICSGGSSTLIVTGATNYTWSPTTNLSSSTGSLVIANPNSTTTYSVIGANGSCTATANSTVNVSSNPTLTVNSGNICSGSPLTLTATGATNYTWIPTINLSSSTGNIVVANPNSTTVYSVIGANGSCTATANSTVNVNSNPFLTLNSGSICSGSSLTLTANGATNYTWSPINNLSSSTGSVVVANPNTTTIYSVLGANGSCTAIATSTVDVTSTPTLSVNSGSICSGSSLTLTANGALNYTWSPSINLSSSIGSVVVANPNSTTIYSVIGANGSCTATANSTVNVNSNPFLTLNSGSICSGSSFTFTANGATNYTWSPTTNLSSSTGSVVVANPNSTIIYSVIGANGSCTATINSTLNIAASPTVAVNSSTICVGQQTGTLTANGASTYSWIPSANLSSGTGSVVTGTPASTESYTILGTDANGCISGTTSTITVNPIPIISVSPNMTVCPSSATTLIAGGASTYTWSPSLNLSAANGSVVIASPLITTTYTVIGATNTCTNSAEVVVTLTINPTLSIVSSPSIICSGNFAALAASGANTYTWSPAATLSSANGSNVNANPITTTIYSVSGTNAFGCLSSTTATLSVVSTPTISAIANPSSICSGQTSTLSAFGASNYTWSPASTISNPNSSSTIATPSLSTIYNLVGSSGSPTFLCTSFNTVQVTVIPLPTVTVSPQIVLCEGQTSTIYAVGANTYTWSPTIGLTNPYAASTNLSPNVSGTFIYTVTAENLNCYATQTVEVVVNPLPIINAGPDATVNIDNTFVLFGTGNTEVGFISTDGIPLSCNYCYSLTVNPQNNTCYTLEGINNFGCRTTDDICVTVTKDWDVFIPNAFTPNGDKNNELFIPVGYGITEMRLTIFDRWGNLVFKSNGETIGWDGKKNGQLCEQGVYVYQAEITSLSGTNLKKIGHVTLLSRVK